MASFWRMATLLGKATAGTARASLVRSVALEEGGDGRDIALGSPILEDPSTAVRQWG